MSFRHGQFVHENIIESGAFKNEKALGWTFHYVTGGTLALTYPAVFLVFGAAMPGNNLIPALIWGLGLGLVLNLAAQLS